MSFPVKLWYKEIGITLVVRDMLTDWVTAAIMKFLLPCRFPHNYELISLLTKNIQVISLLVFKLGIVTEHCSLSRNWPLASKSIELQLEINYCAFYIKISFVKWHNSVYWCGSWIIGLTVHGCASSHLKSLHCLFFQLFPLHHRRQTRWRMTHPRGRITLMMMKVLQRPLLYQNTKFLPRFVNNSFSDCHNLCHGGNIHATCTL